MLIYITDLLFSKFGALLYKKRNPKATTGVIRDTNAFGI